MDTQDLQDRKLQYEAITKAIIGSAMEVIKAHQLRRPETRVQTFHQEQTLDELNRICRQDSIFPSCKSCSSM